MFAFAHNTSVNYTTSKTPYEIVFVKPQIPMSLKQGLYRNKNKFAVQIFVKISILIHIARTAWRTNCWTTYFNHNYPKLS